MRTMERVRKPTELEQEFRDIEAELTEKIKATHKNDLKKYPAGVVVEIASDQEKEFRLYFGSNGKWSVRFFMSGFELGNGTLSNVIDHYLTVTDKDYRGFDQRIQQQQVQMNTETFAEALMGRMRQVITDLG